MSLGNEMWPKAGVEGFKQEPSSLLYHHLFQLSPSDRRVQPIRLLRPPFGQHKAYSPSNPGVDFLRLLFDLIDFGAQRMPSSKIVQPWGSQAAATSFFWLPFTSSPFARSTGVRPTSVN